VVGAVVAAVVVVAAVGGGVAVAADVVGEGFAVDEAVADVAVLQWLQSAAAAGDAFGGATSLH